jgi:ABC-type Fe3+ transport system permease subunit
VLIVAYFVHYIFIGLEGAFLGIGSIDRSLTDAARTLGAGALRRVLGITLPLAARPLAAAWALVFVLVLPEPDIALMTAPPGWELASVSLHNQMHYNYEMQTSALSLIMILIASVPLTLFFMAGPRYGRSRS